MADYLKNFIIPDKHSPLHFVPEVLRKLKPNAMRHNLHIAQSLACLAETARLRSQTRFYANFDIML